MLDTPDTRLAASITLGRLEVANRLAVAPMTRVSAEADGRATDLMAGYYTDFAKGGFGLIVTEGIYTDAAFSQGYLHQPGLVTPAHVAAWREVVETVHAAGGRIVAQLMHAGALTQGNPHRDDTRGPSAVRPTGQQMAFYRGDGPYDMPKEMTDTEIGEAVAGFTAAAANAKAAGFDGVEVHGANGYLLDQFLSNGSNLRTDRFGGDTAARVTLIAEVLRAVRDRVGADFPVGVRISQAKVNDYHHRWENGERDAKIIFRSVAEAGADYVHTTEFEAWQPTFAPDGLSLSGLAHRHSGLPVIANGGLHDPARAAAMVADGAAHVVAVGRGALAQSDWARRVLDGRPVDAFDPAVLTPIADIPNQRTVQSKGAA